MTISLSPTQMDFLKTICFIVASNDDNCLNKNLLSSPIFKYIDKNNIVIARNFKSAGAAYNYGIRNSKQEIMVFVHQDVYLPFSWIDGVYNAVQYLDRQHPDWALLAPIGITKFNQMFGAVWSTSLGRVVGDAPSTPKPVVSFDELMVIMRRKCDLMFDENLPHFHLYGTDIVQTAISAGFSAWVADINTVHNDKGHEFLDSNYIKSYNYCARKWASKLPIQTTVMKLSNYKMYYILHRIREWHKFRKMRAMALSPETDPEVYARMAGWSPGNFQRPVTPEETGDSPSQYRRNIS